MKTVERTAAKAAFLDRLRAVKGKLLPGWKQKFYELHPEYDTVKGSNLLRNVIGERSSDLTILEALEKIAGEQQKGGDNA